MTLAIGTIPSTSMAAVTELRGAILGNRLSVCGSSTFDVSGAAVGEGVGEPITSPITWAQLKMGSPFELIALSATSGVDSVAVASQVAALTPDAQDGIMIQLGGNDLCAGTKTAAEITIILESCLSTAWAKGASYAAVIVPHARALGNGGTAEITAQIELYRDAVMSLAALDPRIYVIDQYSALGERQLTTKNPNYGLTDGGIHLNSIGAKLASAPWVKAFSGLVRPRSYGDRVSVDPYCQNTGSWAANNAAVYVIPANNGIQVRANGSACRFGQTVACSLLSAALKYVVVAELDILATTKIAGVLCRNGSNTWCASMGRFPQTSNYLAASSNPGDTLRFISRPFSIPASVLAEPTVTFGISLEQQSDAVANVRTLKLCKAS